MSLRYQLLAFGLLTLALPWVGLKIVQQMEAALRDGLEASLLASASTAATALANSGELDTGTRVSPAVAGARSDSPDAAVIYAHRLNFPPRIDGFKDDWNLARVPAPTNEMALALDESLRIWAGVSGRFAYFFIEVTDDDIVYQASPGASPYGDRVALIVGTEDRERALVLSTTAPGVFRARQTTTGLFIPEEEYEDRVLGAWQESAGGFSVEMRVPLGLIAGAAGLAVIDVDRQGSGYQVNLRATWQDDPASAGAFIYERPDLARRLQQFTRAGDRYRLVSKDGWILADTGTLDVNAGSREQIGGRDLTERFFSLGVTPQRSGL